MMLTDIKEYLPTNKAYNFNDYLKRRINPTGNSRSGANKINTYDIEVVYKSLRQDIINCNNDTIFKVYDLYLETTKKMMKDGIV